MRSLGLVVLLSLVAILFAATAPERPLIGVSREEVLLRFGQPISRMTTGNREVLNFPNKMRIIFENGVVVEVSPLPMPEPKASSTRQTGTGTLQPRVISPPSKAFGAASSPASQIGQKIPPTGTQNRPPFAPTPPASVSTIPVARATATATPTHSVESQKKVQTGGTARNGREQNPMHPFTTFVIIGIVSVVIIVALNFLAVSRKVKLLFNGEAATAGSAQAPQPPVIERKETHRFSPETTPTLVWLDARLLNQLEWRRFEILVTLYLQNTGVNAQRSRAGADGGVDIYVYRKGEGRPYAYVQCKAWHVYNVGVKPVRELYGVMAAEGIDEGHFFTTGTFTSEALSFSEGKKLFLVSGDQLIEKVNALPREERQTLLEQVTEGDYVTPTCPRCDIKMVRREAEKPFWGCVHYPRCRQTFSLRDGDSV